LCKTLEIRIFKEKFDDLFLMDTNSKVDYKSSDLLAQLHAFFGKDLNLARIKFLSLMIIAMCKVQTVGFYKLATAFENGACADSCMRRIQRFMASALFDFNLVARLVMTLLPHKGPYTLSMDRTNWQFGSTDINALVLAITYHGVAFPLLFKLQPKRGNSNTAERIEMINRFLDLFGHDSIGCLVADREFVGEQWLEYLNRAKIPYYLRIRDNFWVTDPRTGKRSKAAWMFNHLRLNQSEFLYRIYYVNNQLCYLSAGRFKNQDGKMELQIIVSFNKPEKAISSYKDRWQIETAFRAMKSSGFNIEDTHRDHLERLERLFAVMIIAFTWAYLTGIYKHNHVRPIRILKHGRKAKSLFKYGLEEIANTLMNPCYKPDFDIFKILSCAQDDEHQYECGQGAEHGQVHHHHPCLSA
jgi:hypothetical protein